ncbi:MAG: UDP-N-acetylmuramoyl-tripeptide--D-alanyl-D-alanine ligase [Candidatus Falkowbacteria bacterium]|nr:UDP-N-acetylmuramoyl-tripeptide--D-alanyl-D-alanine ligase [Candidatus Falkowbacteria bacterium]
MFKSLLQKILAMLARKVILARQPEIIGVTGSVGKTSTKEAITKVLEKNFQVRGAYKNYNNEIGLPLTVLGAVSAGKNIFAWFKIFKRSFALMNKESKLDYPEFLILEMGIDRPNDMDYLLSIIRPTRAVITKLGQAHLEFFNSLDQLHAEKMKLARALPETGWIIYNYDDENLRNIVKTLPRQSLGYGFSEGADVMAENISTSQGMINQAEAGISFKMKLDGSNIPVFLPGVIGRPPIYSALAAAAVALSYGLNGLEISEALKNVRQPAGRLQLINGKNGTLIIDDTYNSSPDSVLEGLAAIPEIPMELRKRVWAVLGDMKELGALSDKGHEDVGKAVAKKADSLVAVGEQAKIILDSASKAGLKDVYHFNNSLEAADFLEHEIKAGDLLFIKGSQSMRMEKVVKRLMKDQARASELLTRQGEEWRDK